MTAPAMNAWQSRPHARASARHLLQLGERQIGGAGAGIGTLSSDRSSGTVFTVFAGKSIAPLTSVEIRLYKQTQETGATAGFIGVRFSF